MNVRERKIWLLCRLVCIGRNVESYPMALEAEINRWSDLAKALRRPEREAFEDLMDMCRSNAMAAGNAPQPDFI